MSPWLPALSTKSSPGLLTLGTCMSPGLSTIGTFMSPGLPAPGTSMSLRLSAVDYFQTVTKMPVSQAKRTVVVRNLPEDTTKNEIVAKFCEYGSVYKVKFLGEIAI